MTSSAQQLSTLGWMAITGVGVGFVFDLYRVARGLMRPRWLLTALGDLFFWLLVAAFTYIVLLQVNFGEVRSFVFIGIFLGLVFYYRLLSSLVLKTVMRLIHGANRFFALMIRILNRVLFRPGYRLICIIVSPLGWFRRGAGRLLSTGRDHVVGMGRHLVRSCRRRIRLVYRLLKYKLLFFTRKK